MSPSSEGVMTKAGPNSSTIVHKKMYIYQVPELYKSVYNENCISSRRENTKEKEKSENNKNKSNLASYDERTGSFLELHKHERRGWWARTENEPPQYPQVTVKGAVCGYKTDMILDSGATVSIMSNELASILGIKPRKTKTVLEVEAFGSHTFRALGKAKIKLTLGGYLAYLMDIWVIESQDPVILGTDFMKSAGVRLDFHNSCVKMPEEAEFDMENMDLNKGSSSMKGKEIVCVDKEHYIQPFQSVTIPLKAPYDSSRELWVTRVNKMLPTILINDKGKPHSIRLTNVTSELKLLAPPRHIAVWASPEVLPGEWEYFRISSNRYQWYQLMIHEGTGPPKPERTNEWDHYKLPKKDSPTAVLTKKGIKF